MQVQKESKHAQVSRSFLDILSPGACIGRRWRHDYLGFARSELLELVCLDKTRPLGGKSDDYALLLPALNIALEVAADAIPHANKGEGLLIKDVAAGRSQINQALGQLVVVRFLLDGVVECRVTQILVTIGNQEGLQLQQRTVYINNRNA